MRTDSEDSEALTPEVEAQCARDSSVRLTLAAVGAIIVVVTIAFLFAPLLMK